MTVFLCLQCWFMTSIRLLMYTIIHQVSIFWSHSFAFVETLLVVQSLRMHVLQVGLLLVASIGLHLHCSA